jgi:uncharacterized protein YcbX
MPTLARIQIHPVKSFDAQSVDSSVLLAGGALQHDRRFALRDRDGEFVNGKRAPQVHRLRSRFDPATNRLELRVEGSSTLEVFDVYGQRRELEAWLTEYFDQAIELVEDAEAGFPDDTESPGPTVISTATLAAVAGWFGGLSTDEARNRFRANLEIDGVEAFWEDRLVAGEGHLVRFRIGAAELWGTNPCQRCVVPSRNPVSGETTCEFAKVFARYREQQLPEWAPIDRFDHFYRLSVNTRPAGDRECILRVGDDVQILGVV